jgi:hypothetical protein
MVHYKCDDESYQELFEYVRTELREPFPLIIGSDGDKAIQSAIDQVFPSSIHLYCTRHVKQNIERQLMKSGIALDDRCLLLERIFDFPESVIQAESDDQFHDRLLDLQKLWISIKNNEINRHRNINDFFDWFERYQKDKFRRHLIAAVRVQASYVDRNGTPMLFYNNDVEALNHAPKSQANWEIQSLSRTIDILHRHILSQQNESIHALYSAGEWQLVPPYSR